MNCLRCNSPMHVEQYDDLLDSRDQSFYGMHCLMCGDIVDPLILEHRRNGAEPRIRHVGLSLALSVSSA
ncbi:MAG TPA: hypothetical protein VLE46_09970 [Nitrospira sp.]|nr:hypothetical protein [Nitrospira sp.]